MIRWYERKDIEQIAKIITNDWKIAYRGIIDDDYLDGLNYKERERKIMLKYSKEKAIVYEEEGIVKGYSRFGINKDEEKNLGELYALYIKPDERGKGIGGKLLKETARILKKEYEEMLIWCLEENKKGRNFYEKMGGKLYKTRKIEIGNKEYGEVCYRYDLKEVIK